MNTARKEFGKQKQKLTVSVDGSVVVEHQRQLAGPGRLQLGVQVAVQRGFQSHALAVQCPEQREHLQVLGQQLQHMHRGGDRRDADPADQVVVAGVDQRVAQLDGVRVVRAGAFEHHPLVVALN